MSISQVESTRNLAWKSKNFGARLMAKMGWSEGKGLGRTESGRTENVTVVKKTENLGLGATTDLTGKLGWSSTSQSFGSLLESLNSKYGKRTKKAAKSSAALGVSGKVVAYNKRRRSKDVSGYSAEDLRAILGTESNRKEAVQNELGRETTDSGSTTKKAKKRKNDSADGGVKKSKNKKRKGTKVKAAKKAKKLKRNNKVEK